MIALVSYCKFTKLVSRAATAEANASAKLSSVAPVAGIAAAAALGAAALLAGDPRVVLGALSVAVVAIAGAALLNAQSRINGLKLELDAQRRASTF